jgi:hypothetical protein
MDKNKWLLLAAFVAGVMLADKARSLPGLNKLPTV